MGNRMIPVASPSIGEKELEYVTDCVKSGWISSQGPYVKKFEEAWAKYCGCKYGVACNSGGTALDLALATLGVGLNDEVVVPTLTMVACANSVHHFGAHSVFVDSEAETWNINPAEIEGVITSRTRVIMPTHLYGHPCDMNPIMELAERYDLKVVEDCAEAHGAEYKGRKVGSIGDVSCFSFYANKIVTTGDGGMVVTNDEEVAEESRLLRDHYFTAGTHFWHKHVGFSYRMSSLQAAVGLAQVERIDELVNVRRENAAYYNSLLEDVDGVKLPPNEEWANPVYWMYSILLDERDYVKAKLWEDEIETRTFFIPLHFQPPFKQLRSFPVAEDLANRGINLPSGATLTKQEIERVVEVIKANV